MKKIVKEKLYEQLYSSKKGFNTNIEDETLENDKFRKVLYTGQNLQLVLMTLKPGENIGEEIHENDQFFRFEAGTGLVIINNTEYKVSDGSGVIVPAGSTHDIINTGKVSLQLYTIYGPPHHRDKVEFDTKEEAEDNDEEFNKITSE
jgi:mannose-6-phosphate isomerase-like protein (cupin superfamily)